MYQKYHASWDENLKGYRQFRYFVLVAIFGPEILKHIHNSVKFGEVGGAVVLSVLSNRPCGMKNYTITVFV